MKIVAFHGIRGGTGTTSTVAAIGDALQMRNETVLMIDLGRSNMLGLHFGISPFQPGGWARAMIDGHAWESARTEIKPRLHVLPFGTLSQAEKSDTPSTPPVFLRDGLDPLAVLSNHYSVILIDMSGGDTATSLLPRCDLQIMTTEADPGSCALMLALPPDSRRRYLITRFDPISRIQRDIRLLWESHLGNSLIPQVMHRDASVVEALGYKLSVITHRPNSLAAQDALNIAAWCQDQLESQP